MTYVAVVENNNTLVLTDEERNDVKTSISINHFESFEFKRSEVFITYRVQNGLFD